MTAFPSRLSERHALVVLRMVVAGLIVLHGVARLALGVVDDFGGFLDQVGFPAGAALAWTITLVEIGGGGLLALGYFVRPLCAFFVVQLVAGIALVHFPEGWFVVGAGRNGMEYSVLLIVVFAVLGWANTGRRKDQRNYSGGQ